MVDESILWRVTIQYTGRKVYDIEVDTVTEAIEVAKDCFVDESYDSEITEISVEKYDDSSK